MELPTSRIERFLTKQRPLWVRLVVSIVFLLLPFTTAIFDGVLNQFLIQGQWRVFSIPPIIILYIWLITPAMSRSETEVVRSIRSLVPLDDEQFSSLVDRISQVNPRHEWLTICFGAILGFFLPRTVALIRVFRGYRFIGFFPQSSCTGFWLG